MAMAFLRSRCSACGAIYYGSETLALCPRCERSAPPSDDK